MNFISKETNLTVVATFVFLAGGYLSSLSTEQNLFADWPTATIEEKEVKVVVYLPHKNRGYYRGARFDWSGMVKQLHYKNHTFFRKSYDTHDPLNPQHGVGFAEEFSKEVIPVGYGEAEPGEMFMKIGVGGLEKIEEEAYKFSRPYKVVDPFKWTVESGENWIEFRQKSSNIRGFRYEYLKRVTLTKGSPGIVIFHRLKNIGERRITTDQYCHNFFGFDDSPVGSAYTLEFPFSFQLGRTNKDLSEIVALQDGKISFYRDLNPGEAIFFVAENYSTSAKENRVKISNKDLGLNVVITGDFPLAELRFWANDRTLCPEPFVEMDILPGEEATWTRHCHIRTEK